MFFKHSFGKLSLIKKIELYIIFIIIYLIIFISFKDIYVGTKIANNIQLSKNSSNSTINKIIIKSDQQIIYFIEEVLREHNSSLNAIHLSNKHIDLSIDGEYRNIINILKQFQLHLIIREFTINQKKENIMNTITSNISVSNKYFLNKDTIVKKSNSEVNPFKYEDTREILTKDNKETHPETMRNLKIEAIVGKNVFLEKYWYKIGDIINDYKILEIGLDFIKVQDIIGDKIKTVRLEKDAM